MGDDRRSTFETDRPRSSDAVTVPSSAPTTNDDERRDDDDDEPRRRRGSTIARGGSVNAAARAGESRRSPPANVGAALVVETSRECSWATLQRCTRSAPFMGSSVRAARAEEDPRPCTTARSSASRIVRFVPTSVLRNTPSVQDELRTTTSITVSRTTSFSNVREDVRRYIMTVGYGLSSVTSAAAPTE